MFNVCIVLKSSLVPDVMSSA